MSDQQQRKGTMYAFATIGAHTERGGYVTSATTALSICNLDVAGVGDIVNRDFATFAFVGSELDNGDTITDSPERNGEARRDTFEVVKRLIPESSGAFVHGITDDAGRTTRHKTDGAGKLAIYLGNKER